MEMEKRVIGFQAPYVGADENLASLVIKAIVKEAQERNLRVVEVALTLHGVDVTVHLPKGLPPGMTDREAYRVGQTLVEAIGRASVEMKLTAVLRG